MAYRDPGHVHFRNFCFGGGAYPFVVVLTYDETALQDPLLAMKAPTFSVGLVREGLRVLIEEILVMRVYSV